MTQPRTALINPTVTVKHCAELRGWVRVELQPGSWQRFSWEPRAHRLAHFYEQLAEWYGTRLRLLLATGVDPQ